MSAPSGRVYSEYDKEYQAKREQVRKRVARNRNRRRWLRKGKAKKEMGRIFTTETEILAIIRKII